MATTKIAVMHSKLTGRIRCIIIPDNDSELDGLISNNVGEAVEIMDHPHNGPEYAPIDIDTLQAKLNLITGKIPSGDRFCVVHPSGCITHTLIADPNCGDAIDGHALIPHEMADSRWTYHHGRGEFIPPEL